MTFRGTIAREEARRAAEERSKWLNTATCDVCGCPALAHMNTRPIPPGKDTRKFPCTRCSCADFIEDTGDAPTNKQEEGP